MGVGEIKLKYKMLELVNSKMGLEQLVYQERKDNYLEKNVYIIYKQSIEFCSSHFHMYN